MDPSDAKRPPRLHPMQACFVVDDVPSAAADCAKRFGWGPFETFTADVASARFGDWAGRKVTEVALGMAGGVQVELIHVHEGRDAIASYQAEYGTGFQHLGISVCDRDAVLRHLEAHDATTDSLLGYGDLRIAFVDVPTGKAMFELLEREKELERELERVKGELLRGGSADPLAKARDVAGVRVIATEVPGANARELRSMVDDLKERLGSGIVLLAAQG